MKNLFRRIGPLLGWLALGLALVPGILWLVHKYLPAILPGLQESGLLAFYMDFYSGQAGIGVWLWVLAPSLLYLLVRSRPATREELRGCTSLGLAAFKGDLDVIRALLDKGADINEQDRAGHTALHLAVINERVEAIRMLLEAGADVDITDHRFGFRPLHLSARKGNTGVSELLVRYGADLDAQSLRGKTALHLAATYGHLAVVTILLKYLARMDICDSHNKTPLQYAEANGHTEIVGLIREHMSDTWAYLQLVNS